MSIPCSVVECYPAALTISVLSSGSTVLRSSDVKLQLYHSSSSLHSWTRLIHGLYIINQCREGPIAEVCHVLERNLNFVMLQIECMEFQPRAMPAAVSIRIRGYWGMQLFKWLRCKRVGLTRSCRAYEIS